MRIAFVNTLREEAKKNSSLILLTGDLGFSVFEQYMTELPIQYFNMGLAEQNMTGVAAGLAMEGKIPIIYSIAPFVTMRNFEQIRNDICYQNLNVKIVGIGAGFSYGPYGHTHHSLEDIGILRTLPGLTILTPGDPTEVVWATKIMLRLKSPVYLRLGKAGEPTIHKTPPMFRLGKGVVIEEGNDVTVMAISTMAQTAVIVGERLREKGISARIISLPTIKPLDERLIKESARRTGVLVTLEEHSIIGGIGSAVAEVIAESCLSVRFKRLGVQDEFTHGMGNQQYMRAKHRLEPEQVVDDILKLLKIAKI